MPVKSLQSYLTLGDPVGWKPARLLYPWIFPGKDTGLGRRALPQGTFRTQGWSPCLLHPLHWPVLYHWCHLASVYGVDLELNKCILRHRK